MVKTTAYHPVNLSEAGFAIFRQSLAMYGRKDHEHLEICFGSDNLCSIKTTKKPSWIRWIIERIFFKSKNRTVLNVATVAINILEHHQNKILDADAVRQLHLFFNKVRGHEGDKLRARFHSLVSIQRIAMNIINQEIATANLRSENMRSLALKATSEAISQVQYEANEILSAALAYKNEKEKEGRELYQPIVENLTNFRNRFNSIELDQSQLKLAELEGQEKAELIINSAKKYSEKMIKVAQTNRVKIQKTLPELYQKIKNVAEIDTVILCKDNKTAECSRFLLDNFFFFDNHAKKSMHGSQNEILKFHNKENKYVYAYDLKEFSKKHIDLFIHILKNHNPYDEESLERLLSTEPILKTDIDDLYELYKFASYIDCPFLTQICTQTFKRQLGLDSIYEFIEREIVDHEEEILNLPEEFKNSVIDFLAEELHANLEQNTYLNISKKLKHEEVCAILSSDNIKMSEGKLFEFLVQIAPKTELLYENINGKRFIDCIRIERMSIGGFQSIESYLNDKDKIYWESVLNGGVKIDKIRPTRILNNHVHLSQNKLRILWRIQRFSKLLSGQQVGLQFTIPSPLVKGNNLTFTLCCMTPSVKLREAGAVCQFMITVHTPHKIKIDYTIHINNYQLYDNETNFSGDFNAEDSDPILSNFSLSNEYLLFQNKLTDEALIEYEINFKN